MFYHFEFTRGAACLLSTPAPACTTASHANKPAPACMASHERCGAVTRVLANNNSGKNVWRGQPKSITLGTTMRTDTHVKCKKGISLAAACAGRGGDKALSFGPINERQN